MPVYFLEVIVVCLGLVMLLTDAFINIRDKRTIGYFGVLGLLVVIGLLFNVETGNADSAESVFWKFYAAGDGKALFFKGIALVSTLIVLIMGIDFAPIVVEQTAAPEKGAHPQAGLGEFFALPMFACAGLMWMASANHLVSIFVSLETVTITFYIMVAYLRRNVGSLEAGVKYLILGALSTGFLVYGMTWLYGMTGTMELPEIGKALASDSINQTGALFAFALILVGMGFKVGAVPFHNWIPDVYQGAPTPITAFLSVASKSAGFIVFMRIASLYMGSGAFTGKVTMILTILAILTLIVGNLVALPQTNFKRLLAYSSIAHAGFLLMAMACAPRDSLKGDTISVFNVVAFYLGAYLLMTMLAFLVMSALRTTISGEGLKSYAGLAKRSPFLAIAMLISMASLAGIPLTAGFFGKLFVFKLAFEQQQWLLLAVGIIGACAGFYYYLKIAASMFLSEAPVGSDTSAIRVSPAAVMAMVFLMIAIVVIGVNPSMLMNLVG
ncbi:MAG: NADH-quinone oxidoreductase subunit N [Verrucomicrobiales bacterium]|nr:NADH-quinone oxidoreductase subunit N [Verrucomicrobiales bacterium]